MTDALLSRDAEVELIGGRVDGAASGSEGSLVVIEGPPGIGKTSLLAFGEKRARAAGLQVLRARGDESEVEIGFGIVRQLLEAIVSEASPNQRRAIFAGSARLAAPILLPGQGPIADPPSGSGLPELFAALHGLFWVVSNLSDRQPLLISVDDAHWSDAPSLRFLAYLGRRVRDLPLVMIVARRSGEGARFEELESLIATGDPEQLKPSVLDEPTVTALVRQDLDASASADFGRACHQATGGNPFLLSELLGGVREQGIPVSDEGISQLDFLSLEKVGRAVADRISRRSESAQALARSVAVLGGVETRWAAALAGLPDEEAERAADELSEVGLFANARPLRFAHPVLRTAAYEMQDLGQRSLAHAQAAELLMAGGAHERVAGHLLHVAPVGDAQRVQALREAAAKARQRGAPETAARYLRRALEEPPTEDERPGVMFELARVAALQAEPDVLKDLAAAASLTRDRSERVAILRESAFIAATNYGLFPEARSTLDAAIDAARDGDPELVVALEGERAIWAVMDSSNELGAAAEELEVAAGGISGSTPGERALLVPVAFSRLCRARAASDVRLALEPAFGDGKLIAEQGPGSILVGMAAGVAALGNFSELLEPEGARGLRAAAERGSLHGFAMHSINPARCAYLAGRLTEAEALLTDGLRATQEGASVGVGVALAWMLDLLADQGKLEQAHSLLDAYQMGGGLPPLFPFDLLLVSRGRLRASLGDPDAGLQDVRAAGALHNGWGVLSPALGGWRSAAAEILIAQGESAEAGALATDELELAELTELPHVIGNSLRVLGLCTETDGGLAHLERSVEILDRPETQLEFARAMLDLGAALRRANRRGESRVPLKQAQDCLREAVDLAYGFGASGLAERGQRELAATGARPRRIVISGVGSLTASELRVARMAADGMTNRQIASALFVTVKTVEKHLGNAYGKLEIRSRRELQSALGAVG